MEALAQYAVELIVLFIGLIITGTFTYVIKGLFSTVKDHSEKLTQLSEKLAVNSANDANRETSINLALTKLDDILKKVNEIDKEVGEIKGQLKKS